MVNYAYHQYQSYCIYMANIGSVLVINAFANDVDVHLPYRLALP